MGAHTGYVDGPREMACLLPSQRQQPGRASICAPLVRPPASGSKKPAGRSASSPARRPSPAGFFVPRRSSRSRLSSASDPARNTACGNSSRHVTGFGTATTLSPAAGRRFMSGHRVLKRHYVFRCQAQSLQSEQVRIWSRLALAPRRHGTPPRQSAPTARAPSDARPHAGDWSSEATASLSPATLAAAISSEHPRQGPGATSHLALASRCKRASKRARSCSGGNACQRSTVTPSCPTTACNTARSAARPSSACTCSQARVIADSVSTISPSKSKISPAQRHFRHRAS